MKKNYILIILGIIIVAIIYLSIISKTDMDKNSIITENATESSILEKEKYYQIIKKDNFKYYYSIFDKDKNIVKEEETNGRIPDISLIDNHIVKVSLQTGTGISTKWTYYYDVEKDLFSETFYSVFDQKNEKVIYANYNKIIIQDMFDKEKYYCEITDFKNTLSETVEPFKDAKFLDTDKQIQVIYLTGDDYKEITEIIDL